MMFDCIRVCLNTKIQDLMCERAPSGANICY